MVGRMFFLLALLSCCSAFNYGYPRRCYYNGKYYHVGQSFPATDGCNKCTCLSNGQVGCTDAICERPGRCPISFAGAISRRHGRVCRNDFDCPAPQKCCIDKTGQPYCTIVPLQKPGICPIFDGPCLGQKCTNDFDCPGAQKCCTRAQCVICFDPIFGERY